MSSTAPEFGQDSSSTQFFTANATTTFDPAGQAQPAQGWPVGTQQIGMTDTGYAAPALASSGPTEHPALKPALAAVTLALSLGLGFALAGGFSSQGEGNTTLGAPAASNELQSPDSGSVGMPAESDGYDGAAPGGTDPGTAPGEAEPGADGTTGEPIDTAPANPQPVTVNPPAGEAAKPEAPVANTPTQVEVPWMGEGPWDFATTDPLTGGVTDYRTWQGKPMIIYVGCAGCETGEKNTPAATVRETYTKYQAKYASQAGFVIHDQIGRAHV